MHPDTSHCYLIWHCPPAPIMNIGHARGAVAWNLASTAWLITQLPGLPCLN